MKTIGGRGNTATHVFPKNVTKIFQNFWTDFWRKFVFLTFFYFWRKFGFFDEHLEFCRKFLFLMNFVYFCSKIWFFWWKFIFMMKSWIFDKHLYFWHKFRFLSKIFILDEFCLLFCQKFVRGNTATHVFPKKCFVNISIILNTWVLSKNIDIVHFIVELPQKIFSINRFHAKSRIFEQSKLPFLRGLWLILV